jgi:UDP-glucose 4-epimerase
MSGGEVGPGPAPADERRVLVTGGSGFIGSHVVDALSRRGYTPVNFDRLRSPHHPNGSLETVLGEITDADALERAMRGCDAVIHLAAMADVGDVQKDPQGAERANCRGTLAVLEAARRAGVRRVVYGSTIWVYSDCEQTAVDEETLLAPPSHLYTATKLAGELYCRSYAELYGIDYTLLRFGIPYGPRARPAAVVPMFVDKALRGEPLTVAGDGSQSRRFVYVEDLADGIARGLDPAARNRVYNLAGKETVSILQIAETVRDLVGDVEIAHTPARPGDFGGKEVSSDRAMAELGWEPSTPFAEGVRRFLEWRRATPAGPAGPHAGERLHRRRIRRTRIALSAVVIPAVFFWAVATDESFPLMAMTFKARPQTSVKTASPDVGVLVKAPVSAAPAVAAELERSGARASFALGSATDPATLASIRSSGSDAMPQLGSGQFLRWLGTRGELKRCAHRLGLSGHVYYALPREGFTFGQDVLGHTAGATPVAGAVRVDGKPRHVALKRGEVVELRLGNDPATWRTEVARLVGDLRAAGLDAVPADTLLRSARRHR